MPTHILDVEHLPLVEKLLEVLETEPNPVNQQIAIELLAVRHAARMENPIDAMIVVSSMAKHIVQLLESGLAHARKH